MTWIVIRASGLVAYGLLAASVVWGLAMSAGLLGRSVSKKTLTLTHESLSIGALLATVVHMAFLYADEYVEFGVPELLVPGASEWKPLAVAWGIVALYVMVVVIGSFYIRQLIGQKVWRAIHFSSFGLFMAVTVHGITAGTDTGEPYVIVLYTAAITAVAGLTVARVVTMGDKPRGAAAAARTRPATTGTRAGVNREAEPVADVRS